jgi:hypothetical protein
MARMLRAGKTAPAPACKDQTVRQVFWTIKNEPFSAVSLSLLKNVMTKTKQ